MTWRPLNDLIETADDCSWFVTFRMFAPGWLARRRCAFVILRFEKFSS